MSNASSPLQWDSDSGSTHTMGTGEKRKSHSNEKSVSPALSTDGAAIEAKSKGTKDHDRERSSSPIFPDPPQWNEDEIISDNEGLPPLPPTPTLPKYLLPGEDNDSDNHPRIGTISKLKRSPTVSRQHSIMDDELLSPEVEKLCRVSTPPPDQEMEDQLEEPVSQKPSKPKLKRKLPSIPGPNDIVIDVDGIPSPRITSSLLPAKSESPTYPAKRMKVIQHNQRPVRFTSHGEITQPSQRPIKFTPPDETSDTNEISPSHGPLQRPPSAFSSPWEGIKPSQPSSPDINVRTVPTSQSLGQKHDKFTFTHGDVVLRLVETDGTATLFQLVRTVLERHSGGFRRLFSKTPRTMLGPRLPVYDLPEGVFREDFVALNEVLDQGITFKRENFNLNFTLSILRVTTLLEFEREKEYALDRLLELWDRKSFYRLGSKLKPGDPPPPTNFRGAYKTITLTRTIEETIEPEIATRLLKIAFYEVLRTPDLGILGPELHGSEEEPDIGPSVPDLILLLQTRNYLSTQWSEWTLAPSRTCSTRVIPTGAAKDLITLETGISCELSLKLNWPELVFRSKIYEMYTHDPISGLQQLINISKGWEEGTWCQSCADVYRDDWRKARLGIWSKLNDLLDLGPDDDST